MAKRNGTTRATGSSSASGTRTPSEYGHLNGKEISALLKGAPAPDQSYITKGPWGIEVEVYNGIDSDGFYELGVVIGSSDTVYKTLEARYPSENVTYPGSAFNNKEEAWKDLEKRAKEYLKGIEFG